MPKGTYFLCRFVDNLYIFQVRNFFYIVGHLYIYTYVRGVLITSIVNFDHFLSNSDVKLNHILAKYCIYLYMHIQVSTSFVHINFSHFHCLGVWGQYFYVR